MVGKKATRLYAEGIDSDDEKEEEEDESEEEEYVVSGEESEEEINDEADAVEFSAEDFDL